MRSGFLPVLSAAAAASAALSLPCSHAFLAPGRRAVLERPRGIVPSDTRVSSTREPVGREDDASSSSSIERSVKSTLAAASILLGAASSAFAVSGGGLDYASLDISGQDFSNGNYKGKDFTQVLAKATNFAKSNLQGCRFYNSFLVNADYEGADLRGVSFEQANLEGVNLKNVNAGGAYFDQSLSDVKSLEGGDFTDAQIPTKTLLVVCEREDAKGTNPMTGADTRDSLMCL